MDQDQIRDVPRFSRPERWAHWINAVCFFLLLLTGLTVFSPSLAFLAIPFGGEQNARLVHRIVAFAFTFLSLGIYILGDRKGFLSWVREITTWSKKDADFLSAFPKEFFGKHPVLPPQTRFNSGEKVNSLLVLSGSTVLIITGFSMWFAPSFPLWYIRWCYPLHTFFALIMSAAIIGHMYLGLVHPGSKEAINGILNGFVTRKFAKEHHTLWYQSLQREEKS